MVAQFTAFGLNQVGAYLGGWPAGLPRPWLVLVRDAPLPPPKPAVFRRRALGSRVLGVSVVPYLYQLRAVDTPEDGVRIRAVAQAARRLRAELGV